MRGRFLAVPVAAAAHLTASMVLAAAGVHPLVQIAIAECPDLAEAEVRRIATVELGALLVQDGPVGDTTRVRVSCEGAAIELQVEDPITGKSLERRIDLADVDWEARPRLVALAVAELVTSSWSEAELNPVPDVAPTGPRPSYQAVAAVREVVRRRAQIGERERAALRLLPVISYRTFLDEGASMWGGGIVIGRDQFELTGWAADALVEHGSARVSLGKVDVDAITLGAKLMLQGQAWIATFRAGLGIRAGAIRLHGEPSIPNMAVGKAVYAPWGWPMAATSLSLVPIEPLVIEVTGEAGYVVIPVGGSVGGDRQVSIDGVWISMLMGVGVRL